MVVPTKKPKGVTGWAYLRISDGQGGQTVDTQKSSIERWAVAHGVVIVRWFVDIEGKRWDIQGRQEFTKMFGLAKEAPPDFIVAETRQRILTNNPIKSCRYIDQFADLGVEIWTTLEGCLSSVDMFTYVMGGVNDFASDEELKNKAHRALKARRDVRRGSKMPAHVLDSALILGSNGDLVLLAEDGDNVRNGPSGCQSFVSHLLSCRLSAADLNLCAS